MRVCDSVENLVKIAVGVNQRFGFRGCYQNRLNICKSRNLNFTEKLIAILRHITLSVFTNKKYGAEQKKCVHIVLCNINAR